MTSTLDFIIKLYSHLLRLYPGSFRTEFEEQMLLDFADLAMDASRRGTSSLIVFCVQELFDFPINVLRMYWRESRMLRVFRLAPVKYGLRGAIGFGVGFAAAAVAIWGFSSWLFSVFDSQLAAVSVWIFGTFHNSMGMTLIWNVLSLISSALTGLVFGLLFALFSGHRTRYAKYMLAGAFGWFIPIAVSSVLSNSFGWSSYLSTTQSYILGIALNALAGAFFGAIFYIAESGHKKLLQLLAASVILSPLVVYLYTKLLFYVWLEITAWFFPALMTLMLILLGGMFALARSGEQKTPWAVIVGMIAYPVLYYSTYQLAYTILNLPTAGPAEAITPNAFLLYEFTWAGVQAFLGLLFGLLLGLIWGYQKKNNSLQIIEKL